VTMEPLPPIPVAPRVIWRLFRLRVMPVIVFLGLVALATVLWSRLYGVPSPEVPDRAQAPTARKAVADAVSGGAITFKAGVRHEVTERNFNETRTW
jgi:hypothetical protein